MSKHYITKTAFEAIFEDCMNVDIRYFSNGGYEKVIPRMYIRDFDIADPNNDSNDRSFFVGELDEAWKYFQELSKARVMNVNGSIYIDAFE